MILNKILTGFSQLKGGFHFTVYYGAGNRQHFSWWQLYTNVKILNYWHKWKKTMQLPTVVSFTWCGSDKKNVHEDQQKVQSFWRRIIMYVYLWFSPEWKATFILSLCVWEHAKLSNKYNVCYVFLMSNICKMF